MKQAPTLIDSLYRTSFKNERIMAWTSNSEWRKALVNARRFVLDDAMSTFLGDLSTQAFKLKSTKPALQQIMVDNLRVGARLPHATTWIEYNLRNCQTRSNEILERPYNPLESPKMEGWLLQQHPKLETAFIAHIVTQDTQHDFGDGFDTWTFPVALAWTVDQDTVLPWRTLPWATTPEQSSRMLLPGEKIGTASELATGIIGYKSDKAAYVFSDMVNTPNKPAAITNLISEWGGVMRRMWALLSTINDLPVLVTEVRQAKGFVARGEYRKFLHHKTITLTVPTKLYRKTARDALAIAHRRGCDVRSHWRKDWRNPLSPLCEHEWVGDEKHMTCSICKGRKIWIKDHSRGDSSRGFVTHDYNITHEQKEPSHVKETTDGKSNPDLPVRPDSPGSGA